MANSPVISVVMATYNNAQYISGAIQSIRDQSYSDYEFIIVDDGSTDGSRKIVEDHARRDARIKVVYQKHCGLVSALNNGCGLAKGEYIARLDSDDLAMPGRFEQQITYMMDYGVALLGGSIECIDSSGIKMSLINYPSWETGLKEHLFVNCYIAHTTVMFRRDVFISLGGYRSEFEDAEDYDLFLRMSDHHVVDNLSSVLCQYRIHNDQISSRRASQVIISSIGARIATWARRSGSMEPQWIGKTVSREDIVRCGIRSEIIDALISNRKQGIGSLLEWNGMS
jgi:glycosyltransferase involved in cell wall biosynthesis